MTIDVGALGDLIADHIAGASLGTLGTDLYIQVMPEAPVNTTAVVMTGGPILPGDPVRRPSFQILHRNTNVQTGLWKSGQLHNLFDDKWNVLDGFPGRIVATSEPGAMFKDGGGRAVFPLNFGFVSTARL